MNSKIEILAILCILSIQIANCQEAKHLKATPDSPLPKQEKTPSSFLSHLRSTNSCPSNCYNTYCNNKYCQQCDAGYYQWGGACYRCGAGCKSCRNQNQCDACNLGYYNEMGTCRSCITGCSICNNPTTCS